MTIKDTLKKVDTHKRGERALLDTGYWEVRVDVEVVEHIHVIEYIRASSEAEARTIATNQFNKRTPVYLCNSAPRRWKDDEHNYYALQQFHIAEIKKRKKFILSPRNKEILRELLTGKYLVFEYTRWYLVDPTVKTKWGNLREERVSSACIESLFRKGLLTDLITVDMTDQEIKVQTALGSLPTLKAYTVDKAIVKALNIRL
jgi:hypothetical protein